MTTTQQNYRVRNGQRQIRCAGYVSWDSNRKGPSGWPIRTTKCFAVWMPAGRDYADCGGNTDALSKALEAKAGPRKNVECRECWQC